MRANAPFPVLLAFTGIVFVSALLPATLSAKTAAKKHAAIPHEAISASAKHTSSRSEKHSVVHAVALQSARHQASEPHRKHIALAKSSRHHPHVSAEQTQSDATANRVHAWVKSQKQTPSANPPNASSDHAANEDQSPPTSAKAPVSVISTIRNTNPTVVPRPQLPPVEDLVADTSVLPTLYNRRGRLIVPPALKGSHEILIHQNLMADGEGLDRIQDDADLDRLRKVGALIAIPTNATLRVDDRLPANRRYCRPWTALFLDTLARQHYAHFQTALQVNSAVRTVEFQQQLIHRNGNAAPAEGDTASPHLTGQAIDIAKRGLSMAEIAWLRGYLLPLVQQGKVDVEEEFQQSCFHISVYKKYMPQPANRSITTTHREGIGSLGISLR